MSSGKKEAGRESMTSDTFQMQQHLATQTESHPNSNQQGVHFDMQRMHSPVFNIHIHVPPYQGENLKMYLPRIQPVIHLHFDELARNLEINREEQNQEATYRAFQKLMSMTSPKFGNVRFHYQDKMNETISTNREFNSRAPCSSANCSNDTGHVSGVSGRLENLYNYEISDCCENQNSIEDSDDSSENYVNEEDSYSEETLKRKFNLKEAVVVLEDVCKTDYYKNMVAASSTRDLTECNQSECDDFLRRLENTGVHEDMFEEYGDICFKRERESASPEHGSPSRRKIDGNNYVNHLSPSNQMLRKSTLSSPKKTVRFSLTESDISAQEKPKKTLNALVKGYRFSDILSRFQVKKCEENVGDSFTNSDIPNTCGNNSRCDYESDEGTVGHYYDGLNRGRINFKQRDSIDRNQSHHFRNQPYIGNSKERLVKMNSLRQNRTEHMEIGPGDTALRLSPDEIDLDGLAWTSGVVMSNSRREIISPISPRLYRSVKTLTQTRENKFINLGVSDFRLDLLDEMGPRKNKIRRGTSEKKAAEVEPPSSSECTPPKKMRRSNEESRTPAGTEDYIPLQASGPTKFAVAPLSKVNPYKSHDARNFKNDMLFGNRINRFRSSDRLRVYQMKQKAAKTQSK